MVDRAEIARRANAKRWGDQKDRFWSYVDKDGPVVRVELGPCWRWKGPIDTGGYGQLTWDGKMTLATHVSLELAGIERGELHALHRCDNRPCVQPDHLFLGLHQDNYDDMEAKGRGVVLTGANNGRAKLTEFDAATIRVSNESSPVLGRRYGVTHRQVLNIKKGISWNHVRMC